MAKNNIKQHFVFDLDDTLIDGRQFCGETIARAISQLDPTVDEDLIVKLHDTYRGGTIVDLYRTILGEIDRDLDVDELLKIDSGIQKSECYRMNVFDGVVDILEFLKSRGKKLHVCTNRTMDTLVPILEHTRIADYFENIISCIDRGHKKPDPTCLTELMAENGNNKDDFIYFGDSTVDSRFAANSGIDFIIFDQYLNEKNLFKKLINMFLEEQINGQ